jgi:hypothetical protein
MSSGLFGPVVQLISRSVLRLSLPSFFAAPLYCLLSLSQALEQRVAELEEENGNLRAALNLPPSNMPPLGKGPTGKDKPKPPYATTPRLATDIEAGSRGSSADSPTSTRAQSLSPGPSTVPAAMRPSPNAVHSLAGGSWDQSMLMGEEQNQRVPHSSSPSTGYRLPGLPAHTKAPSQHSYPSPAQPSARPTLPGTMHMPASQDPEHFGHPTDRPLSEAHGSGNYPVRDLKENQQRFPHSQPYSVPEAARLPQYFPSTRDLHYSTQTQQHRDAPSARKRTISDPPEFSLIPSMERLACRE